MITPGYTINISIKKQTNNLTNLLIIALLIVIIILYYTILGYDQNEKGRGWARDPRPRD